MGLLEVAVFSVSRHKREQIRPMTNIPLVHAIKASTLRSKFLMIEHIHIRFNAAFDDAMLAHY